MLRPLLLLLFFCFGISLFAQQARYALVIGNADYPNASLGNVPINDANAMRDALTLAGFEVHFYTNLDQAALSNAIAAFGRKIKDTKAAALFYYSGHGVQHNNTNYLVPIGAELSGEDDIEGLCIPIGRITARMSSAGTSPNLVFLDACRSFPLNRNSKSLTQGLAKETFVAPELLVAYATAPGSTATLHGEGGLSLYTSQLIKHLKTPGLVLETVLKNTRRDVLAKSNGQQRPDETGNLTSDFYFFEAVKTDEPKIEPSKPNETKETASTTKPSPPFCGGVSGVSDSDTRRRDVAAYNAAKTTNTSEAYQKYLNDWPEGIFRSEAASAQQDLLYAAMAVIKQKQRTEDDDIDWDIAQAKDTEDAYREYLQRWPKGRHAEEAKDRTMHDPFGLVFVKGGTFKMGCTSEQQDCEESEKPAHDVTLSDFFIGKYEVTQQLWDDIMGKDPSDFKNCPQCPVYQVDSDDVQKFLKKLNQKYPGKNYRLPTEAEWEYAARGGQKSRGFQYSGSDTLGDVAWYFSNSEYKDHPVGQKIPNELGLYDMSGNVEEWCSDWYSGYSSSAQTNPTGPVGNFSKMARGGSSYLEAQYCRVAFRNTHWPGQKGGYKIGLRLARSR